MKLSIIGAGSTYTPGLISRWYETKKDRIHLDELCLYDVHPQRLDIIGDYIMAMMKKHAPEVRVYKTTHLQDACIDASFVVIQCRVGLNTQRRIDEHLCIDHGFVGQETTGPAGFALALRQIPVGVEVAQAVDKFAPDAWIVSVANPAGILAEALIKYGHKKSIGMCHGGYYPRTELARALGVEESRVTYDYYGLNHLGWIQTVFLDGKPISTGKMIEIAEKTYANWRKYEVSLPNSFAWDYSPPISVTHYMREFFMHDEVVAEAKRTGQTRADKVVEIERACIEYYQKYVGQRDDVPPELARRGGDVEYSSREGTRDYGAIGYSDGCMNLIDALTHPELQPVILNVLNEGSLNGLPDDACVEINTMVNYQGYHRMVLGDIPISVRGMVQAVKAYETMTVEAALSGDRNLAFKALMSNPICLCRYQNAKALFDALIQANCDYLPRFFKNS